MFHRAEPDEPGFGVMISTPGSTRSSQLSMPSGLPSRTTKTTTDEVGDALGLVVLPVLGDQALVDQAGHVGLEGEVHDVGVGAGHDGAALVAGGAVRRLELDALALVGALEVLEDGLVGGLQDGEADQVDGRRRAVAAAAGVAAAGGQGQHARRRRAPAAALIVGHHVHLSLFVAPHPSAALLS